MSAKENAANQETDNDDKTGKCVCGCFKRAHLCYPSLLLNEFLC